MTAMCKAAPRQTFLTGRIKKDTGIRRGNNNVLPILPDSCNSLHATRSCESLF